VNCQKGTRETTDRRAGEPPLSDAPFAKKGHPRSAS
jgi:hypothetical protein